MAKNNNFRIDGIKEVKSLFKHLEKFPTRQITSSVKKAMKIPLKDAKNNAPYESGDLERGLILKKERSRKKGKSVYQVTFDKNMNDIFVKESKKGKRSYYPASQEYGFKTRNGGYVLGRRYLREAMTDNEKEIEKVMITDMIKKIDKIIKKAEKKRFRSK